MHQFNNEFNSMKRKVVFFGAVAAIVKLAFLAGVCYVAWHFISKVW